MWKVCCINSNKEKLLKMGGKPESLGEKFDI